MEESKDIICASSHDSIVGVVGLHDFILVAVDIEKAHIQIGCSCGAGVSLCRSLRLIDYCIAWLAFRVSHLDCSITLYSIASLHAVARLVKY